MIVNRLAIIFPAGKTGFNTYFQSLIIITRIEHVHKLTLGGSGAELLDFAELGLETIIDPGQDVVPEMNFTFQNSSCFHHISQFDPACPVSQFQLEQ